MNWDAVGAIGEIAGAVAVVATLIYFARQIRESTVAQQTTTDCMLTEIFNQTHVAIIGDPDFVRIVLLAHEGGITDPSDRVRMKSMTMMIMNGYASAWRAYKAGHLSQHSYEELVADTRILYAPGILPLVREDLAIRNKVFVQEFLPDLVAVRR